MRDHHGDEIAVHITGGPDCHGLHHLRHCGTAGGDERLVRSAASPSHCGIARRARATHDGRGETEGQERGRGRPRGPLRQSESPLESIGASHCCLPVISGFGAALAPGFVLRAHRALATRTRAPSCRSVGGLITMCAPWASPPVTSTQLPRSRPMVTVWYRTVESEATITTCGGPSRITSAVAGTRNGGVPAPSASCTWAYIPGRNTPVGLATRTSVSSVRAVASSAPAVRATRPRSVSPGTAGTVTTAGFPIATAAALSSGTVTYTLRVSVCATVNRLPGALPVAAVSVPLPPPAGPTRAPGSTLRAVMTPANGATTRSYACSCTSRWRLASALFEFATASLKAACI